MMHRRTALKLGAALATIGLPAGAAESEVAIHNNVELSGTGVTSGSMWKMGVDLAVKEINAAGGILGRKIAITHQDNQSQPQIAKAVATKAADAEPYVMLGPIFSGDVNVSMAVAENAEIPMIMGGEAANLTQQGMKYLFRTSLNQASAMPKLANYLAKNGVKSMVVVWGANDFGKGGRDAMVKEMAARNIKLAADISTEPGQMDFSPVVVNASKANADALFSYMNEEESARFLIALKKLGYDKPVYGETVLVSQKVIELAGPAANGAKGHVGLSVDAPNPKVQEFGRKFMQAYNTSSDHNGIKGYTAVYLVKAATEKLGKFDRKAMAAAIHGGSFSAAQYPGLLMDESYDDKGDLDRESYLVEIKDGKQVITEVLPPVGKK
ncbi:ABC transporter substrate-binding protein [Limobrevibacterium gyesilva]|uniref:ABC transporter substrate-binding protein n=1 Tax=Limobrevibacterium gyesilva TaxID=2991712 RepID=A0AA41YPL5_9PROT|nr:ABC transporter substrate-binding protein [Limobrevibacterium gyesilva]MCW3474323.1 ABC transporter substrate-binding protein [Limobrevibacterium gyesilva]